MKFEKKFRSFFSRDIKLLFYCLVSFLFDIAVRCRGVLPLLSLLSISVVSSVALLVLSSYLSTCVGLLKHRLFVLLLYYILY